MLDRKFIGYKFEVSEKIIESWEISQFAKAIRDFNPIYFNVEKAKNEGFRDLPIPPTFFTKMTFSGKDGGPHFFSTLGIDFRKLLDGGREYKYYKQCCAGDVIEYQTRVENIIEREGKRGKMDIVTAITTGKDKETNEKIFDAIINLVVFH
ncbi:MAG: FAS1-like dehydratase domain-containing protein [Promethearchaeota archaeon]